MCYAAALIPPPQQHAQLLQSNSDGKQQIEVNTQNVFLYFLSSEE
jgi:hypothetical protein